MSSLVQKVNFGPMAAVPLRSAEAMPIRDIRVPTTAVALGVGLVGIFLAGAAIAYEVGYNA